MIVIDSSSLILLSKATVLETISSLNSIVIGRSVYEESATRGKELSRPDSLIIEKLVAEGKILVAAGPLKERAILEASYGIRKGENETVALSLNNGRARILTDDRKNMTVCKTLGLEYMTALDAIVELGLNGRITKEKAKAAFESVAGNGWIREDIIEERRKKLLWRKT
jgi:predicted nucleic acid-binding protein